MKIYGTMGECLIGWKACSVSSTVRDISGRRSHNKTCYTNFGRRKSAFGSYVRAVSLTARELCNNKATVGHASIVHCALQLEYHMQKLSGLVQWSALSYQSQISLKKNQMITIRVVLRFERHFDFEAE